MKFPKISKFKAVQIKSREELKKYLNGRGIEIGALQNPLNLEGLDIKEIKYVDRLSVKDLREHYPELEKLNLVDPDIVDDCEVLSKVKDDSLDFIIANHLIEHLSDPLTTLSRWYTKLKKNGVIFLAVPDKRRTFDKERELTTLEHLIIDSNLDPETRKVLDKRHFYEWAIFVQKKTGAEALKSAEDLYKEEYSVHYHTYIFEFFQEVINYLRKNTKAKYKILDYSHTPKDSNEFIFILQK